MTERFISSSWPNCRMQEVIGARSNTGTTDPRASFSSHAQICSARYNLASAPMNRKQRMDTMWKTTALALLTATIMAGSMQQPASAQGYGYGYGNGYGNY